MRKALLGDSTYEQTIMVTAAMPKVVLTRPPYPKPYLVTS
jgi:hypothetical protein